MREKIQNRLALLGCGLLMTSAVTAQQGAADRPMQIERLNSHYVVNADGSYVETQEQAIKVLKDSALGYAKDASVTYSTSIQEAEVVSAYTLKANGRRIDVPPVNYQKSTHSGQQGDSPVYSDQTTLTVVFPELEVGDTTVFAYRLTAREPMFPGQFSMVQSYSPAAYYGQVRVTMDLPESLPVRWQSWQIEQSPERVAQGRRHLAFSWRNHAPVKPEALRDTTYKVERYPGFILSTFTSYAQIAQVYGDKADAKAAVTPRIQALADTIAGDAKEPREVARRLYEWVSREITYAGNCIGLGAVVPRDLDFVLDNKMGDCKDHATLLQALLKARGIDSTQALVNAGQTYELPEIPVASMVNHVINYVPSLDLYLDSTASIVPFGSLPDSVAGKPVLLVHGHRDGTRTPTVAQARREGQKLSSTLRIQPDGSVHGTQTIELSGQLAASVRNQFRDMSQDDANKIVRKVFAGRGLSATGTLRYPDPKPMLDTFSIEADFRVEQMLPASGGFPVASWFINMMDLKNVVLGQLGEPGEPQGESSCSATLLQEEFVYEFPDSMHIVAVPGDLSVDAEHLRYQSRYRREGQRVSVNRVFDDTTPGPLCSAEYNAQFDTQLRRLLPDLKAQIVYLESASAATR